MRSSMKLLVFIASVVFGACLWVTGCSTEDRGGGPGSDVGPGPDQGTALDDELLSALARISACLQGTDPIGIGLMYSLYDAYQRQSAGSSQDTELKMTGYQIECFLGATDCEEILGCIHANAEEASVCSDGDGEDHCYDQVLVECPNDPERPSEAYDCGAMGLVCGEGEYDADCGEEICDPVSYTNHCDGDLFWECDEGAGVVVAKDCRYAIGYHCHSAGESDWVCYMYAGGTCGTDPDGEGEADCVGTGPECDWSTFETRCTGTTLVSCLNGRETEFDCRNLGSNMTCGAGQSGTMECIEGEGACNLQTPETCNQGIITFCAAGQVRQLNCTSYGYGGCHLAVGPTGFIAYCSP